MRGVFALPLAVFVLGVPAGLVVWLNGPSTSDHGTASRTQYEKMISNENVPSDPPAKQLGRNINAGEASGKVAVASTKTPDETRDANEQSKSDGLSNDRAGILKAEDAPGGTCLPIGVTARGAVVFPLQCREMLKRYRGAYAAPERRPETALAIAPKPTAAVDNDHETVGSVGDKPSVNAPTAHDDHSALDPKPRLKAKAVTDGSRPLEDNTNRPGKVLQSSRTLNDRHWRKRFSELLNNPLALRCISCLMFGY
jgi:hypothetical protein